MQPCSDLINRFHCILFQGWHSLTGFQCRLLMKFKTGDVSQTSKSTTHKHVVDQHWNTGQSTSYITSLQFFTPLNCLHYIQNTYQSFIHCVPGTHIMSPVRRTTHTHSHGNKTMAEPSPQRRSLGERMSSILRIILTTWVASIICCFLERRVSITCCSFMSAHTHKEKHSLSHGYSSPVLTNYIGSYQWAHWKARYPKYKFKLNTKSLVIVTESEEKLLTWHQFLIMSYILTVLHISALSGM